MVNLTRLDLGNNRIKSFNVFTGDESFPNLKWLNISNNKPNELPSIKLPKLEYLDISGNKIEKVNDGWQGHANLRTIKAMDNKFKSLAVFKVCPKLEELYVAQNAFTALSGWEALPALKRLHCRRNRIEKIDEELPPLEALEYINLRQNKIPDLKTVFNLFQFPNLKDISVFKNPVEVQASSFNILMSNVLSKNTKLERFCKVKVEDCHKLEAYYLGRYNWEREQERLKQEAAEQAAREAAENE